jgi:polyhydroxyalkanoate synthesis regulator phasin
MSEEQQRSGLGGIGEGIRTGIGILSAFKEAFEQTLDEAVERGEFTPERARQAMREAADRIQLGLDGARERLDFVSRREYEDLRDEISRLRDRIDRLEGSSPPEPPHSGIIITE